MRNRYGRILFWFFLTVLGLFTLFAFGVVVAAMLGYVSLEKGVVGALLGALGSAIGIAQVRSIYLEALRQEVLPTGAVSKLEEQLKDYFRNRLGILPGAGQIRDSASLTEMSNRLMQQFLHFLESVLRVKSPDTHFEISIFVNAAEPIIACYYNSGGAARPSSADLRAADPQFYRKQNYEAVELLEKPSPNGDVMVISRTEKAAAYSFRNQSQRARIKSTCLCLFSDPEPMVIVLVADRDDVFDEADGPLKSLATAALMSVAYERKIVRAIKLVSQ